MVNPALVIRSAGFELLQRPPFTTPGLQWLLFVSKTKGIHERAEVCWRWGCYPHCKWRLAKGPRSRILLQWNPALSEWVISVLRPHQHSIGYMGDDFYRSKDPTNSIKVLKDILQKRKKRTKTIKYTYPQTIIYTVGCGRPPLLLSSCKKLEFKTVSVDGLGSGMGKW